MAETKALKKLRGDEKIMADQARRIAELQTALLYIRSLSKGEQEHPTDLHMTCLSIIQKTVEGVLDLEW